MPHTGSLAAVLVLLGSVAAAADLSVVATSPPAGIYPGEIANCPAAAQTGNPTGIDSRFSITNPWQVAMSVWYDYYDFGTDSWAAGTHAICTIGPNRVENICDVSTPLALGGRGTGTLSAVPYIRLKGTDPDSKQATLTKTLPYTFVHFEAQTETNAKVKISALRDLINQLSSKAGTCYLDFCCGASGAVLDAANADLAKAEAALKKCDLSAAYNLPANAINAVNAASHPSDPACISAVAAVNDVAEKIAAVEEKISSAADCETRTASQTLALANLQLLTIHSSLEQGDFGKVSQDAAEAAATASEAEDAIKCAAPPAGTGTPTITPPATTPPTSPTTTQPSTPAQPPSGKGVCWPFFILLLCLFAAWRQKVR